MSITHKILTLLFISSLLLAATTASATPDISELLDRAIAGEHRNEANRARDVYRHPKETLLFFGLQPDMRVLEITPGGGWYTEILAPVLREHGKLIAASFGADHPVAYLADIHTRYMQKLDADPGLYDRVERILFKEQEYLQALTDESVDMVVTFRNSHNWIRMGEAEAVYAAIYRILKSCGTLGVVQHRAAPGSNVSNTVESGYVPEEYLVRLIQSAGFRLIERSDINANPHDTRDHPEGVWALPPSLRLGDEDRDKYLTIGESDRMTLRFIKPIRLADSECPAG